MHQLGGFDRDGVRAAFDLEPRFEPLTVIALGPLGDASALPEALQEREAAPRVRRPLTESLLAS